MERIQTGIKGLDERIAGGLPNQSSSLICGTPGSCKTIFCLEYLYRGATEFNQNGLYVTIEEDPERLRDQADQFGWNLRELEEQGRLSFLKIPIDTVNLDILRLIKDAKENNNAQRLIIDSLSILAINAAMYNLPIKTQVGDDVSFASNNLMPSALTMNQETKQFIYLFVNQVSSLGATSIFVSDSPENGSYITRDTVSEFVCDSVLKLGVQEFGKTVSRTLEIKKMRATPVHPGIKTLEIVHDGLNVTEFTY
ncbi:MAG: ATPase domain-containing protein [Nanobdellota archaeon]